MIYLIWIKSKNIMQKYCLTPEAKKDIKDYSLIIGLAIAILLVATTVGSIIVRIITFFLKEDSGFNIYYQYFIDLSIGVTIGYLSYMIYRWIKNSIEKC